MAKPQRRASVSAKRRRQTGDRMHPTRCRIMVLGIGGAGNDTVNRLIESGLTGAECVAINTDLRDLNSAIVSRKVLIGESTTRGLSAKGDPEIGKEAIRESRTYLESLLENVDVVFIGAGLGGGTGTGAAPIAAEIARGKGAVVVGMVTTPLRTEENKVDNASRALKEMLSVCDTVVVIDSSRIMESRPGLPAGEVFKVADQVLANMIAGIVETLTSPSLVNLDFAEFKNIVSKGGIAVVGVGESDTRNRAEEAVRTALNFPLLDTDYVGAKGALINVSGDLNMTLDEANRVREIVTRTIGRNALISWGARVNSHTEGSLKVTVVMTGVNSSSKLGGFGDSMPRLYDLESSFSEPEKHLRIDLDLDQIEDLED